MRPASAADESEAAWQALAAGGHIAVMRHATAPGVGDPEGFRLEDCSTQRTLSEKGRGEARRIGEAFRARGVDVDDVYSSRWCRCLETAELLGLGPVQPLRAAQFGVQRAGCGSRSSLKRVARMDRRSDPEANPGAGEPSGEHHGPDRGQPGVGGDRGGETAPRRHAARGGPDPLALKRSTRWSTAIEMRPTALAKLAHEPLIREPSAHAASPMLTAFL